jgi:hypothetical protein
VQFTGKEDDIEAGLTYFGDPVLRAVPRHVVQRVVVFLALASGSSPSGGSRRMSDGTEVTQSGEQAPHSASAPLLDHIQEKESDLLRVEEADRLARQLFGHAAEHDRNDQRVIAFVERNVTGINDLPQPHRFFVFEENGVYIVRVVSLEHLRDPTRFGPALVVYVKKSASRLSIERIELGM